MLRLRYFFERHGFSVCSRLADWMGMKKKNVRIFFIYSSFFAIRFWFFYVFNLSILAKNKGFNFI